MNTALSPSELSMPKTVVIGTRKSQLAMVQTELVLSTLSHLYPSISFSILGITTTGDKVLDIALSKIGTKSLFTKELEVALADGTVDLVVHSLKDLPTTLPEGMALGAVLEREDPRDAVVMGPKYQDFTLETLPPGSVVGTSSVRRSAQLKRRFPHLRFQDVRGNLNTRLKKLDDPESPFVALLLAYAGLHRLGWDNRISQILPEDVLLHAVGQGAIGIECRLDDQDTLDLLSPLDHYHTRLRVSAEREFMKRLEGGCSVPLGIASHWSLSQDETTETLVLKGSVTSLDGSEQVCDSVETSWMQSEPWSTKLEAATHLGQELARKMIDQGAKELLDAIKSVPKE